MGGGEGSSFRRPRRLLTGKRLLGVDEKRGGVLGRGEKARGLSPTNKGGVGSNPPPPSGDFFKTNLGKRMGPLSEGGRGVGRTPPPLGRGRGVVGGPTPPGAYFFGSRKTMPDPFPSPPPPRRCGGGGALGHKQGPGRQLSVSSSSFVRSACRRFSCAWKSNLPSAVFPAYCGGEASVGGWDCLEGLDLGLGEGRWGKSGTVMVHSWAKGEGIGRPHLEGVVRQGRER